MAGFKTKRPGFRPELRPGRGQRGFSKKDSERIIRSFELQDSNNRFRSDRDTGSYDEFDLNSTNLHVEDPRGRRPNSSYFDWFKMLYIGSLK
jgi:hypothetical protein